MTIERTISLEVKVHCCRVDDGSIAYTSEPNRMNYGETADEFEESLVVWRDRMLDFIEADLEETVDKELCQKIGGKSLKYCGQYTEMTNIRVEESEIVEVVAVPVVEIPVPEVKIPEVEKVAGVKVSKAEKEAAKARIKRLETLFGTDLEPRAREEIERIERLYGISRFD